MHWSRAQRTPDSSPLVPVPSWTTLSVEWRTSLSLQWQIFLKQQFHQLLNVSHKSWILNIELKFKDGRAIIFYSSKNNGVDKKMHHRTIISRKLKEKGSRQGIKVQKLNWITKVFSTYLLPLLSIVVKQFLPNGITIQRSELNCGAKIPRPERGGNIFREGNFNIK